MCACNARKGDFLCFRDFCAILCLINLPEQRVPLPKSYLHVNELQQHRHINV